MRALPLSSSGSSISSAVLYTKERMILVGEAAAQAAFTDPLAFEPAPKRRLGEPEVRLSGLFVPVTDLVAAVLGEVLARAADITGGPPRELVLTFPENWSHALQQRLATAAEVAGIDIRQVRLVGEAAAAAEFYTATGADYPVGTRLAVFDFGAGTCGVAVLDKQANGAFTVAAADGIDSLGGLDLDARIHAWVLQQLSAVNVALAAEVSDVTRVAAHLDLADSIRNAKEALSEAHSAEIVVSGTAGSEALQLTRDQFDQLIGADITRAVRLTESVLYQANTVRWQDDPITILMTGGCSHIPLLQSRLAALGRVEIVDAPKAVLTHGALRATPAPQEWQSSKPPPLPTPVGRKSRRSQADAATRSEPERSRRRIRITSRMRKTAAWAAIVAIVVSGIGLAAVTIYGSITAPSPSERVAPPRTTLAPPPPKVPTAMEFTVNVLVTENTCAPDGNCIYKYTIEPKYIGLHPLPETPFTVFYEVTGGHQPQKGEFTVHKDQAKILKDVVLDGPPGAQLKAVVMNVAG
jgi:hypothetical protein